MEGVHAALVCGDKAGATGVVKVRDVEDQDQPAWCRLSTDYPSVGLKEAHRPGAAGATHCLGDVLRGEAK